MRILCVDDEPLMLHLLETAVKEVKAIPHNSGVRIAQ